MAVMDKVKAVTKRVLGKVVTGAEIYDMSSKEARQIQVKRDFENAKSEKFPYTAKMIEHDNYYNNKPYTERQAAELREKLGLNFTPPVLTDPYIQVESQIDTTVPTFQFTGREDQDAKKAREREEVVNYVLYNNGIDELNIDNERSLNALGNAFFKVAWDDSIRGLGYVGDLVVGNPDPANIFPDPNAYDVDDCEYIIYAFRGHRRKLRRVFGEVIDTITNDGERTTTEIYDSNQQKALANDETLLVLEYWYRDKEGDIACSIQVNYVEVKHIPKYWKDTRLSGNQMYPIIKYGKIPVRKSFWDKGEIETCKDLFDAGNREFITAILNDAFMSNDILLYEENSLAEGQSAPGNVPGEAIKMKDNKINNIRRLGGVANNTGILNMITFINEKIQETNGNYDSAQGKEPVRVTTASGIAQLNEKSESRKITKKAGRTEGFKRLAQLIDWSAMEFYNTDREIMIGVGNKDGEQPQQGERLIFNRDKHATVSENGQMYFPKCDVEIVAGDGIRKSKAFTLQATQELAATPVTPENIGIVLSQVEMLDLPNKDIIKQSMLMAVQQQIQQRQAASQPPTPPQPKAPSETISFADLPPSGKIQLAQQVGITLTPQDFASEIQTDMQEANKTAMEMTKLEIQQKQQDDKQAHELTKMQLDHKHKMELELSKAAINAATKGGDTNEVQKENGQASGNAQNQHGFPFDNVT